MREVVWLALLSLVFSQALGYKPGDVVYAKNFHSQDSLKGWSPQASWASLVPGYNGNLALQVTVPEPASGRPETRIVCSPIDLSSVAGYQLFVQVLLKADNVSKPLEEYNGVKVMLHLVGQQGEENYDNTNNIYGTFDWTENLYGYLANIVTDIANSTLCIGLQDSSGTIWVDGLEISVYRAPPPPLPKPPVNPPPPYTGHPPNVPRFRGTMSPQHYYDPDIQNLGLNWKANLMRWQMDWGDKSFDDRNNITKYDEWLNYKLNETDHLLAACIKYGIKVVVDLHTPPGGRDPVKGDMLLQSTIYQNHFYEVWRKISTRYKGHPAVWGYDICNEPLQTWPGQPGALQWQPLAQETVAIIRQIDPDVTILLESEGGGDPSWYRIFRPINDTKVVYEVHMYVPSTFTFQGVPGSGEAYPGPVYPSEIRGVMWNITQLQINTAALFYAREFQLAFNVHMYAGEFSAIRWATNGTAVNFLKDCITTFEEWGWDWTYHAYREWQGWSVEYDENFNSTAPVTYVTARQALLRSWFEKNVDPYADTTLATSDQTTKIHIA